MNKRNYLLELGVEEIPAQYIATMALSLENNAKNALMDQSLSYDSIKVFYTPRRMALMVYGLADSQADQLMKIKGPSKAIAFKANNEPSEALIGFLRKNSSSLDNLQIISDGKNEYVSIEYLKKGKETEVILGQLMEKVILSIYNPNPMRWADFKIKFIRPIRWLLSLYGNSPVSVALECTKSGNVTYGHRTLANYGVEIHSADEYIQTLRNLYVLVNQNERRQKIQEQIAAIEKSNQCVVETDDVLLEEINNLIEYPTAIIGEFEKEYLCLPECVIKSPLKTQQRYFPVYRDGKITNAFVFVRNGNSAHIDNVLAGNERVIRPRLADAKFFFEKDQETTLEGKADLLHEVVFVNKLGSYADKSLRVIQIAKTFANKVHYTDTKKIEIVGRLMKADLVSNLVREYTDTQGLVGGEFARIEHYDEDVCEAIAEQYLPNFLGDKIPSSDLSAIMAIADKLDTVMGLCAVGLKPSGSADPYGLRRLVLGIFQIANERLLNVDIEQLIDECAPIYLPFFGQASESTEFINFIKDFFLQRLKVFLHDQMGYKKEELDAISLDDLNIYKSIKKADMVRLICNTNWYKEFLFIFKRINNLISSTNILSVAYCEDIDDVAASEMFNAFNNRRAEIVENIREENYEEAIKLIVECSNYMNDFMDKNKVLSDDEYVRNNRLAFFNDFCRICSEIIKIN